MKMTSNSSQATDLLLREKEEMKDVGNLENPIWRILIQAPDDSCGDFFLGGLRFRKNSNPSMSKSPASIVSIYLRCCFIDVAANGINSLNAQSAPFLLDIHQTHAHDEEDKWTPAFYSTYD